MSLYVKDENGVDTLINSVSFTDGSGSSTSISNLYFNDNIMFQALGLSITFDASKTPSTTDNLFALYIVNPIDLTIDWGDGSDVVEISSDGNYNHVYPDGGIYTADIRGKGGIHIGVNENTGSTSSVASQHIESVDFGKNFIMSSCEYMFADLKTNFTLTGYPDFTTGCSFFSMFYKAYSFNQDISNWDTSNVTDMSYMFSDTNEFNQDISNWDTSNVTDMSYMFELADAFNQDISNWDTGNVTNISSMFAYAGSFSRDMPNWNTSNVTDMSYMFESAGSFNGDISNWNTSNVTDMSYMFESAGSFNGDISNWNTSNVTDMSYMFESAGSFNGDISNWNTSNVTDMSYMFEFAGSFNGDISNWNTSNVTYMNSMFYHADAFNQDISNWDVTNVTYCTNFRNNSNLTCENTPALNANCTGC